MFNARVALKLAAPNLQLLKSQVKGRPKQIEQFKMKTLP